MNSCISAIGIANPPNKISQLDVLPFMINAFNISNHEIPRLTRLYEQSGIDYRYSVLPDFDTTKDTSQVLFTKITDTPGTSLRQKIYAENAIKIGKRAALNCFETLPENINQLVTHLITVSCTGMHAPGLDIELVEELGLNKNTERTCINFMGCYGAINALKVADYICRANAQAKVLIVSVELCTLHFQKTNTLDNWVANSIFSDGGAAVLVENTNHRLSTNSHLIIENFYAEFIAEAKNDMAWTIGDYGFEMKLSSKVSKHVKNHLQNIVEKLLSKAELTVNDVTQYAIHPGGRRILEAAEEALMMDRYHNRFSYDVLKNYGNMSSATLLFVLQKIMAHPKGVAEDRILGAAFGPGLTVETVLFKHSV